RTGCPRRIEKRVAQIKYIVQPTLRGNTAKKAVSGVYAVDKWMVLFQKWQKTVYKIFCFYEVLHQFHQRER
ncbi:MAG TPA: hypothetical protein VJ987_10910, partial [Anaerolineales bacterium]|nr:hypothetical protein [Anaerolineales bacterium]